jgi:hypothetical protein
VGEQVGKMLLLKLTQEQGPRGCGGGGGSGGGESAKSDSMGCGGDRSEVNRRGEGGVRNGGGGAEKGEAGVRIYCRKHRRHGQVILAV